MESRVVGFLQEVCFILCCGIVWGGWSKFPEEAYQQIQNVVNSECRQEDTENLPKVLWCHNHRTVDGKWQRFQQFQQAG
ncbi:hypothetical protein MKW92_018571, partial [Papaver armeniacum]